MTSQARKNPFREEYVQVPNKTAQSVEKKRTDKNKDMKRISLQSLGLITNMWSYDVEKWELHKTELYNRYEKNKETSVKSAWNDLVEARYIVEFKYRNGKKWDYVYYYNIEPFTEEEVAKLWEMGNEEFGEVFPLNYKKTKQEDIKEDQKEDDISGLDFQDLKMKTSNCRPQNQEISNIKEKQDLINEKFNESNIKTNQPNIEIQKKNDEICNSDLPVHPIQKTLETMVGRLVSENISILEIENHYNTLKDTFTVEEYNKTLYDVLKTANSPIINFSALMDDWLKRSRNKKNEFVERKEQKQPSKPIRTEILPDWFDEYKLESPKPKTKTLEEMNIDELLKRKEICLMLIELNSNPKSKEELEKIEQLLDEKGAVSFV